MSFGRRQRLAADGHALRALLRSVPLLHCNPVVPRVPRVAPGEPCDLDGGARAAFGGGRSLAKQPAPRWSAPPDTGDVTARAPGAIGHARAG